VAEESDLIWGAECIKDFLRDHCGMTDVTTKAVYHLADRNRLPIAKFNGKLFVSRSAILSHFREALDQAAQTQLPQSIEGGVRKLAEILGCLRPTSDCGAKLSFHV
jgi:hypothetical protein